MGTRGRVKALTALAAARQRNRARIAAGKAPIVGGKKVSLSKFARLTGGAGARLKKRLKKDKGLKGKIRKAAALAGKKAKLAAKLAKGKPGQKVRVGAFAKAAKRKGLTPKKRKKR